MRTYKLKKKEVDWDPNAVCVHHMVEFLTGKIPVDSSCRTDDLLCFALHMIMIDSGYQPTVSCSAAGAVLNSSSLSPSRSV